MENEAALPPKFDWPYPLVVLWLLSGHPESNPPLGAEPCLSDTVLMVK